MPKHSPLRAFCLALLALIGAFLSGALAQEGAYLGVQYRHVTDKEAAANGWPAPRGTFITMVIAATPAERAGFKAGDIVLSLDGTDVTGQTQRTEIRKEKHGPDIEVTTFSFKLADVLATKRVGDTVALLVFRAGKELSLSAKLGTRPPLVAEPARPAAPAKAAAPACKGMDVMAELKEKEPEAFARIMAAAAAVPNSKALLWRIDKAGLAPSHLFGTIHISDDRVHALSPAIKSTLEGAKRVALEAADLSQGAMAAAFSKLGNLAVYADGKSLKSDLPAADYQALEKVLERRGAPIRAYEGMRPWLIGLSLALPLCEQRRQVGGLVALDQMIASTAKGRGIPVVGLETLEDQMRAMASLSPASEIAMLQFAIRFDDRSDDLFETLTRRYLAREIGAIWPLQHHLLGKAGLARTALDEFEDKLLTRRNHTMRDAALPLLAEGALFIGVGAAHLPGNDGLVELLRGAGYTVTAVE